MSDNAFVYILSSYRRGTLYIGVTGDLIQRIYQHRTEPKGFVKRHAIYHLVWYASFPWRWQAAAKEKSMKKWSRAMKVERIEVMNADWDDLAASWLYQGDDYTSIRLGSIRQISPKRVALHCYKRAKKIGKKSRELF